MLSPLLSNIQAVRNLDIRFPYQFMCIPIDVLVCMYVYMYACVGMCE